MGMDRRRRRRGRQAACERGQSERQRRRAAERARVRAGSRCTSVVGVSTPPEPACGVVPHSGALDIYIAPPPLEAWGAVVACEAHAGSINRALVLERLRQVGVLGRDQPPQDALHFSARQSLTIDPVPSTNPVLHPIWWGLPSAGQVAPAGTPHTGISSWTTGSRKADCDALCSAARTFSPRRQP